MSQRPKRGFTQSYSWGERLRCQGRSSLSHWLLSGRHCSPCHVILSTDRSNQGSWCSQSKQANVERGEIAAFDGLVLLRMPYHFSYIWFVDSNTGIPSSIHGQRITQEDEHQQVGRCHCHAKPLPPPQAVSSEKIGLREYGFIHRWS